MDNLFSVFCFLFSGWRVSDFAVFDYCFCSGKAIQGNILEKNSYF